MVKSLQWIDYYIIIAFILLNNLTIALVQVYYLFNRK